MCPLGAARLNEGLVAVPKTLETAELSHHSWLAEADMFCPECGCEYREGFYECADCGVPLMHEPPRVEPPPEKREFVTILETTDPALISVVKSLLEGSNIWYVAQGEAMSSLFPGTVAYHPVAFQVAREDEEKARDLLREFEYEMWEGPIEP